jgi:hypothetical protein
MRLIPRHRQRRRPAVPRIAISQEEITADLNYPRVRRDGAAGRRSGAR